MPVTNAPPRPSTVNAPATCSGSPVATYAAISSSVTSAKCTVVEAVAGRDPAGRGVAQAVAGVQHAGAAAHRLPAADGLVGVARLAERLAVELEHRVAAEHQRAVGQVVARGDGGALELGELQRQLGRRQPVELRLVDAGDDHHRVEAGAAQRGEPGGGGRGQHERGHAVTLRARAQRDVRRSVGDGARFA